jgi:hypothetical protein
MPAAWRFFTDSLAHTPPVAKMAAIAIKNAFLKHLDLNIISPFKN